MKKKRNINSPWLLGMADVCAYLGEIDERTLKKSFIDKGLHPRSSMGKLNYYHKDDVDRFLAEHNEWQEVVVPAKQASRR